MEAIQIQKARTEFKKRQLEVRLKDIGSQGESNAIQASLQEAQKIYAEELSDQSFRNSSNINGNNMQASEDRRIQNHQVTFSENVALIGQRQQESPPIDRSRDLSNSYNVRMTNSYSSLDHVQVRSDLAPLDMSTRENPASTGSIYDP